MTTSSKQCIGIRQGMGEKLGLQQSHEREGIGSCFIRVSNRIALAHYLWMPYHVTTGSHPWINGESFYSSGEWEKSCWLKPLGGERYCCSWGRGWWCAAGEEKCGCCPSGSLLHLPNPYLCRWLEAAEDGKELITYQNVLLIEAHLHSLIPYSF